MYTITIDLFNIINHTQKDTDKTNSQTAIFSSHLISQVTDRWLNLKNKHLQIILKITEKNQYSLMQCNWIQIYNYIKRIIENIDSLNIDYVKRALRTSWMEPIFFQDSLKQELSDFKSHIEEHYLARIDQKITAKDIQQVNSWLSETATKSYYKIRNPKNKNKRKHIIEKDISGTFHEEKTALQKCLLQQGYLHELVSVANATFTKNDIKRIVGFLKNCRVLLTSTPGTYIMIDQWLPKTKIATSKNESKLDSEFESKISLIQSKATESLNKELELVNQKLDKIMKLLSLSSNIGSYLSTFDVRMANIISNKIKLFKNRIDTIQSLRETCTEDHERVSIVGLTRLLVEDVNIQYERLNNVINRNLDQVTRTRRLLSTHPSNGKLFGKTITQLDKELEETQIYLSQAQQTTTKITSPPLNSEKIKILNENIKVSIEITDMEKHLTDLANIFTLCTHPSFTNRPKYFKTEETNTILNKCHALLRKLEITNHPLNLHELQQLTESYRILSQSLLDTINQERILSSPFGIYISKLLRHTIPPLQELIDIDAIRLYQQFFFSIQEKISENEKPDLQTTFSQPSSACQNPITLSSTDFLRLMTQQLDEKSEQKIPSPQSVADITFGGGQYPTA